MRKKFGYQAMAAVFAAAMIVSGAGMYQTTAKAAEGQIRTPQQKTAVETQESAKLKAEAASVDPTEDGEYTLTFEAKQEGSDEESMLNSKSLNAHSLSDFLDHVLASIYSL